MNRHQIGYTLWPAHFDLIDPGPLLDEAEEIGVEMVEIPLFATRLIANGKLLEPALRIFERRTRGRPFGYSTHAMLSINLMDRPERLASHEEIARACIELTARFGGRHMVLHCGLTEDALPDALKAAYARQRESLARLGDFAATHGVLLCVETIWNFDGRETALPSRLAAEILAIGHNAVCATLDFAHSALQCDLKGAEYMAEIAAIAPLSRHLHFNDCFGTRRAGRGALPGEALASAAAICISRLAGAGSPGSG